MFVGGAAADRAGLLGTPVAVPAATTAPSGDGGDLALVEEAWRAIQDNYVDARNLDNRELAYGAIRGMTEAVGDEGHTSFLTAAEAKAVDDSLSGTFVGIGVQVSGETDQIVIGSVIPGTPAEEAGLRRGDRIVAVNGTTTDGETLDEVVARVRGPEGERVTLTIGRSGGADFDVTIVRRKFDLPLVSWAMVPGRTIAYVRLEQFATGATKAMKAALEQARRDGATAVVLDLRANPGGYVNEAIGITSPFVGDGAAYRTIDRGGTEKEVPVEPGGAWTDLPVVVLADGDSASSAEIVTGAIQDAGRGRMVGEMTFGTGTVLGRFDLSDGSSLRIGVERWLTRGGRPIWHEGLLPDVTVELADDVALVRPDDLRDMTPAELGASADTQLLKALELLRDKG
jgi:carboxyl-terminal processing protease